MYIRSSTLSESDIRAIVRSVSAAQYAGNVVVENASQRVTRNGYTVQVKIGTLDSRAHGSRTSSSGRHGRWASWHAFRDVLTAVFDADPRARVRTAFAVYDGRDGFESVFPRTYYRNAGSLCQPVEYGSLSI